MVDNFKKGKLREKVSHPKKNTSSPEKCEPRQKEIKSQKAQHRKGRD